MKIKKFDVVKLKNENKAIILMINKGKNYFAEIIDKDGKTIEKKQIELKDIQKVIYTKELNR